MPPRWTFRQSAEVREFVSQQEAVVQHKIRKDVEKLETRGPQAGHPLVGHLDGAVYYLRSKVDGSGIFRCFFFQDGQYSFLAFYGYQKKQERLPGRIKKQVMKKYRELTKKRG